jgi:hypothetical protein
VNILSRLRSAFLKTWLKAAAPASRLPCVKRSSLLLAVVILLFVALAIERCWRYGVSCARPFARRRFNTRRPAFVAIRARNPWVRARLILLG